MSALAPPPAVALQRPRHRTAADWLGELGNVPPNRIIFDPPPGTVTLEHYERIDGRVDGVLVELINGTLVEKTMGLEESEVGYEVGRVVGNHIKANKLGGKLSGSDGMIRMKGRNVRMPDFHWTAPEDIRDPQRLEAAPLEAPTLAVEVISESNTAAEIRLKLTEYFASGCRLAWVLYPTTRTLRVHDDPANVEHYRQLTADDTLDGGDVLPGFCVKIADLFDV